MSASWGDRVVAVTGAGGFIGSHLVEALARHGARVRALVRYNSRGRWGWLDQLDPALAARVEVRAGDVRDAAQVDALVRGAEVVFHLAALIGIPYSYEAPGSYVDTNVGGTLHVLEAVRRHGCARMVQTSTSEVYGSPQTVPIRESHSLQAQSPYSATKIAADKLCESYHLSFGTPVVTLRPFNTYGPRQSARAVIPTILAQALAGRTRIQLGALAPVRDFTYVSDTVAGFEAAGLAPGVEGRTVQLGTGEAVSVRELVAAAGRALGCELEAAADAARERPPGSEIDRLESDPALAAQLLAWKPAVPLVDGLAATAAWMRTNLDAYRPDRYER